MSRVGQEVARIIEDAFAKLFAGGIPGSAITGQVSGASVGAASSSSAGAVVLSDATPEAIGSADAGTATDVSRSDHVHAGGGSLDVTDGSTTVTGVTTLVFDGGTVTDNTGGQATVTVTGGGGGAPDTAEYLTTASDGGLSAEVVIPGLAGHPDIKGHGGGTTSMEFDASGDSAAWTWSIAPTTFDIDTTIKSHLYADYQGNGSEVVGTVALALGTSNFDLTFKFSFGGSANTTVGWVFMGVAKSDLSVRWGWTMQHNSRRILTGEYKNISGSLAWVDGYMDIFGTNWLYVRLVRSGSNLIGYYSHDGLTWTRWNVDAESSILGGTIDFQKFCIAFLPSGSGTYVTQVAIDWIRVA